MVNLSISVVVLHAYALNKCPTMNPRSPPRPWGPHDIKNPPDWISRRRPSFLWDDLSHTVNNGVNKPKLKDQWSSNCVTEPISSIDCSRMNFDSRLEIRNVSSGVENVAVKNETFWVFFFFFYLICLFISYRTTITQCILTITLIILK